MFGQPRGVQILQHSLPWVDFPSYYALAKTCHRFQTNLNRPETILSFCPSWFPDLKHLRNPTLARLLDEYWLLESTEPAKLSTFGTFPPVARRMDEPPRKVLISCMTLDERHIYTAHYDPGLKIELLKKWDKVYCTLVGEWKSSMNQHETPSGMHSEACHIYKELVVYAEDCLVARSVGKSLVHWRRGKIIERISCLPTQLLQSVAPEVKTAFQKEEGFPTSFHALFKLSTEDQNVESLIAVVCVEHGRCGETWGCFSLPVDSREADCVSTLPASNAKFVALQPPQSMLADSITLEDEPADFFPDNELDVSFSFSDKFLMMVFQDYLEDERHQIRVFRLSSGRCVYHYSLDLHEDDVTSIRLSSSQHISWYSHTSKEYTRVDLAALSLTTLCTSGASEPDLAFEGALITEGYLILFHSLLPFSWRHFFSVWDTEALTLLHSKVELQQSNDPFSFYALEGKLLLLYGASPGGADRGNGVNRVRLKVWHLRSGRLLQTVGLSGPVGDILHWVNPPLFQVNGRSARVWYVEGRVYLAYTVSVNIITSEEIIHGWASVQVLQMVAFPPPLPWRKIGALLAEEGGGAARQHARQQGRPNMKPAAKKVRRRAGR